MFKLSLIALSLLAAPAFAGDAKIVNAKASKAGNAWRFDVTIRHDDSGWDHYANGWYVLAPDGKELGYRELLHPHEHEQPFTRSLGGVKIPDSVKSIFIRAHDSVHGASGKLYEVKLR